MRGPVKIGLTIHTSPVVTKTKTTVICNKAPIKTLFWRIMFDLWTIGKWGQIKKGGPGEVGGWSINRICISQGLKEIYNVYILFVLYFKFFFPIF